MVCQTSFINFRTLPGDIPASLDAGHPRLVLENRSVSPGDIPASLDAGHPRLVLDFGENWEHQPTNVLHTFVMSVMFCARSQRVVPEPQNTSSPRIVGYDESIP